jgi:hypothetical protein
MIWAAICLAAIAIVLLTAAFAPAGYQDATGFHFGTPTTDDTLVRSGEQGRGGVQSHTEGNAR